MSLQQVFYCPTTGNFTSTKEVPAQDATICSCSTNICYSRFEYTVEPPNNGQVGDRNFVHYSEVVPSSEVLPLRTLKLLSYFKNDIVYTLDVNSMSWSIQLVECVCFCVLRCKETTLSIDKPMSITSFTCP